MAKACSRVLLVAVSLGCISVSATLFNPQFWSSLLHGMEGSLFTFGINS